MEQRAIDANELIAKYGSMSHDHRPVISLAEIDAAPTIEPKRGEWIYPLYAPRGGSYVTKQCSCCGWSIPYSEERGSYSESNFCPSCGADMRKE